MTEKKRKQHSAEYKFRIALEAAKENKTLSQLASEQEVGCPLGANQISQWKRQLLEEGASLFKRNGKGEKGSKEEGGAELYEQIGRLKMELEWLKKKLPEVVEAKRDLIEAQHEVLSIRRQCELVGLSRASYYYEAASETPENLQLMRLLDEQYMKTPFYGYRRMTVCLRRAGYAVNPKRIARLMGVMGIEALYPKPRTTMVNPAHKIYPYLLRGVKISYPNQVWSTDITYVPMPHGFMYLVAVIDWFSRYVLSWRLSNTLDSLFCLETLSQALTQGKPEIFNTDQGVQFTALSFTSVLEQAGIQISMDGRGRALDNIFIERFCGCPLGALKYEDIYLYGYDTVPTLQQGLTRYFQLYNHERPHQSLDYQTPAVVYSRGFR